MPAFVASREMPVIAVGFLIFMISRMVGAISPRTPSLSTAFLRESSTRISGTGFNVCAV